MQLLLGPGKIPSQVFFLSLTIYTRPHNDLTHPIHSHVFHLHHHNVLIHSTLNHYFHIHPYNNYLVHCIHSHFFYSHPHDDLTHSTQSYFSSYSCVLTYFSRNPTHTLAFFFIEFKRTKRLFPIPNNLSLSSWDRERTQYIAETFHFNS